MSLLAQVALTRGSFSLDVSLELEPGRTVALIGPNGSGKSTLVEALAGLLPLASGEIRLDGDTLESPAEGVRLPPQKRPIGVLFQGLWLFPHLSVRDNVAYGLWAGGERRTHARARVAPLLERLELAELAERRPDALSGGEAQRVALARALAPQPRLLLLDEPLSALDLEGRPRTRAFLQEALTEFAGPRLVITHDPLEALLLADHLVVLEEGRVVQSGPTAEVRRRPRTRYVATLAGVNLVEGELREGVLRAGALELTAEHSEVPAGAVLATIHPSAVRIAHASPAQSEPNTWRAHVASLELDGDRVRVRLDVPSGFCAELAAEDLDLRSVAPGTSVFASVVASDVSVYSR